MPQSISAVPIRFSLILALVYLLAGSLWAQNSPGVARISLIDGEVGMLRQGDTAWTSAALNTPLVSGDEIYVANAGRAELELDANDALRLAGNSDLRITRFFGRDLQLQFRTGTLSYTASGDEFLRAEIETPNMSVRPLRAGVLRVDVVDATHTSVTVRHGSAEVFAANGRVEVTEGQQIQIQGAAENAEYQVVAAPDLDTWDQWVQQREDRIRTASSYRYMNSDIYGGEDLDGYGNWVNVPNYGYCWQPNYFVSDWAPYYYGRWMWTPFYGWSWVSYEPWGWAPFHFGRWFWATNRGWVWWPGFRHHGFHHHHIHSVWAPAFVHFFFGHGRVGWVPLAPFEPFVGFSRQHFMSRGVSVAAVSTAIVVPDGKIGRLSKPAHFRNLSAPGGFIAISSHQFANGRVDQGGHFLSPMHLSGFHPVRGTPPVIPTARSMQPLPGRPAVAAPARFAGIAVFHRPQSIRRPMAPTLTISQIAHAMEHAQRAAGLSTPSIARPGGVPVQPGNSAFVRTPSATVPGGSNPIRVVRPSRGPLLLTNEGPVPAAAAAPLRPPEGVITQPGAISGWHRFGSPGAQPTPPLRRRPMPSAPARPGAGQPMNPLPGARPTPPAAMHPSPSRSPLSPGFHRFSDRPATGTAGRGISRGTENMTFTPPTVAEPPRPPSASVGGRFQNHPIGPIEVPVIVEPRSGNWTWHAGGTGQQGPAAGGARSVPMTPPPTGMPPRSAPAPVMRSPSFGGGRIAPSAPPAMARPSAPPAMARPSAPSRAPSGVHSAPRMAIPHGSISAPR